MSWLWEPVAGQYAYLNWGIGTSSVQLLEQREREREPQTVDYEGHCAPGTRIYF